MLNLQSNCLIGLFFTLILQVNPDVIVVLEERGLKFVGKDETRKRMEVFSKLWLCCFVCVHTHTHTHVHSSSLGLKLSSCIHSAEEEGLNFMLRHTVETLSLYIFFYVQILELPSHPFYIGVQFHPEFKSRPRRPSPLFLGTYYDNIFHH